MVVLSFLSTHRMHICFAADLRGSWGRLQQREGKFEKFPLIQRGEVRSNLIVSDFLKTFHLSAKQLPEFLLYCKYVKEGDVASVTVCE